MPSQLTATAKAGPGFTVTAQVYTNLTEFRIDLNAKMIYFTSNGQRFELDVNAATTFTVSISGGNYTLTIS